LKITTPWDLRIAELLAAVLDRDEQPAGADALGEPR
jgi:hypothetical protein